MASKKKYVNSENYKKHFDFDTRIKIQKIISENRDAKGKFKLLLKDVGDMLQNDPSSISKEVKRNRIAEEPKKYSTREYNNERCENFQTCTKTNMCSFMCNKHCKRCINCLSDCSDFKEKVCDNLKHFPWVCNGCLLKNKCHLKKYFYYSDKANLQYKQTLSGAREGISITNEEYDYLNNLLKEGIDKKQPVYHIHDANKDNISISSRTIYNYIERGILSTKAIDLPRKVKFKKRYSKKINPTQYKKIKENRTYEDFQKYMNEHPDASVVQMDTVEGRKGGKLLLTLHFVKYNFQLAFLIDSKETKNVEKVFNDLYSVLGKENYSKLFAICLTDNGCEFSDPESIEYYGEEKRTTLFYCHPYSSYEKGSCEKNHEFIRVVYPKGSSFDDLTQDEIDIVMSNINSTIRKKSKSAPYDFMVLEYGKEILDALKIKKIDPNNVCLRRPKVK